MKILVSSKPSSFQAVPTKVTELAFACYEELWSKVLVPNRDRPSFLPILGSLSSCFADCFLLLC